jgi:hypothetical protein
MAGSDSSSTQSNNKNFVARDGRSSTFDRSMTSFLKARSPYAYDVLDTDENKNTKYKYFKKVGMRRPEAIAKNSIALSSEFNNTPYGFMHNDSSFGDIMYATVSEDKPGRLRDYRTVAAYSEVADALDEICDECINYNDNKEIVVLNFINDNLKSTEKEDLHDEFSKFIEYFDLKNKGWRYFRQFLIEGEIFFENIIHKNYTKQGILAVQNLPADNIDPVYGNIQNMLIKGFLYKKPIFDSKDKKQIERYEYIPFEENQIIYVNNEQYNETKDFVIPFIENCRRSYRQLSMIEDSVVIHRLVHAPLRFIFNVDVGRMPVPQAESYLRKLQQQYWSTKTFDSDQNDIVKKYNPQSMLDSYWFAKRQGQEATNVQTFGGQPSDGNLDVLDWFLKKLYRSLKVPTNRLKEDSGVSDGSQMLNEELKFAKMIVRQQQKFAAGIKKGFITHLKLREKFEEYDIEEQHIDIEFVKPGTFFEMRENQKKQLKVEMYNSVIGTQNVSDIFAKKKYLEWSDKDILADREFRRKDAEFQWELQQIAAMGPGWKAQMAAQAAPVEGGAEPPPMGGGGMPSGGSEMPPPFGGGPAVEAGGGETPEPFGGEANTTPPTGEGQPAE